MRHSSKYVQCFYKCRPQHRRTDQKIQAVIDMNTPELKDLFFSLGISCVSLHG